MINDIVGRKALVWSRHSLKDNIDGSHEWTYVFTDEDLLQFVKEVINEYHPPAK